MPGKSLNEGTGTWRDTQPSRRIKNKFIMGTFETEWKGICRVCNGVFVSVKAFTPQNQMVPVSSCR